MTFTSRADVPAGIPVHHHCLATIEKHHDPKFWADASTVRPQLLAWSAEAVVGWVRERMLEHLPGAGDEYGRWIKDALAEDHPRWSRLANTLQRGRWWMDTFQLGTGRKLVFQVIGYADAACQHERRPSGHPYTPPLAVVS